MQGVVLALLSVDIFGAANSLDEDALRGIHGGPMWPTMCDAYRAVLGTMSLPGPTAE